MLHALGLQTTENSKFYAISSRFKPFSNKGKSLILQYTVKHEQKIDCGGGYVKIFSSALDQKNMSRESQYYIMFGELDLPINGMSDSEFSLGTCENEVPGEWVPETVVWRLC